jgi:hypothetical protein
MLDRSSQPNLFDPRRLGVAADEEDTPPPRAPEPPSPRRAPRRDYLRGGVAAAKGLLGERLRDPRVRRYLPVAVLVLLVLTNPAGCGRSVTTTVVTRPPAASPKPAPAAPRTSPTRAPARSFHATQRRSRRVSSRRQPTGIRVASSQPLRGLSRPSVPNAPPVISPPAAPQPPHFFTGSEPDRSRGASGDEFGFER